MQRQGPVVQSSPAPWSVRWVTWAALFVAVLEGCRGMLWIALQPVWQEVPLQTPWWFLAALSLGWSGGLLAWVWAWYRGRRWAWQGFPVLVVGYLGYQWVDRLVLSASPLVRPGVFWLCLHTGILALTWWLWRHPQTRSFFGVVG